MEPANETSFPLFRKPTLIGSTHAAVSFRKPCPPHLVGEARQIKTYTARCTFFGPGCIDIKFRPKNHNAKFKNYVKSHDKGHRFASAQEMTDFFKTALIQHQYDGKWPEFKTTGEICQFLRGHDGYKLEFDCKEVERLFRKRMKPTNLPSIHHGVPPGFPSHAHPAFVFT